MGAVVVERKNLGDLVPEAVKRYLRQEAAQFLGTRRSLEGIAKTGAGQIRNGNYPRGILFFGKRPQSPLTRAVVHAGRLRQIFHIMGNRIVNDRFLMN